MSIFVTTLLAVACLIAPLIHGQQITSAPRYPAHWWTPVSEVNKPDWEILPQEAGPGEVILSKRNELGLLSNFAATPFTYRGKLGYYHDSDIVAYYLRARFYDPSIRRFLTRDTLTLGGSSNLYTYASNNPLSYVDPSGHRWYLFGVICTCWACLEILAPIAQGAVNICRQLQAINPAIDMQKCFNEQMWVIINQLDSYTFFMLTASCALCSFGSLQGMWKLCLTNKLTSATCALLITFILKELGK